MLDRAAPPQEQMLAELRADDPIFLPSGFWSELNKKNWQMLAREGMENFKRTVAQNYFNWLIPDDAHPYFTHAQRNGPAWLLTTFSTLRETARLRLTTSDEPRVLTDRERDIYRRYVCHVWAIMRRYDFHRLRWRVSEPKKGNPFPVKIGPKFLSQDLANSIIECNLLTDLHRDVGRPRVAEIGAGYGRLAHVFAATQPGTYFVFDIPPALAVAQWYIEQVLGSERVFRFRHFDSIDNIAHELSTVKVAFFTPNQLRKFPDRFFDTVVTISTLPEMQPEQVEMYLIEFQRLSRGFIFLKQWRDWKNPVDGTHATPADYVFPPPWRLTLDRQDPVIPDFVNMVWAREAL